MTTPTDDAASSALAQAAFDARLVREVGDDWRVRLRDSAAAMARRAISASSSSHEHDGGAADWRIGELWRVAQPSPAARQTVLTVSYLSAADRFASRASRASSAAPRVATRTVVVALS